MCIIVYMYKIMAPKPQIGQIGTRSSEPGAFLPLYKYRAPKPWFKSSKKWIQYKIMTPNPMRVEQPLI